MLTKGDKVVMHTCGEAQHYDGKIWTCRTDEYTTGEGVYKQNLVFLEGFSGCFLADYLQKVNVPEQLLAEVRAKDAEIEQLKQLARNYEIAILDALSVAEMEHRPMYLEPWASLQAVTNQSQVSK